MKEGMKFKDTQIKQMPDEGWRMNDRNIDLMTFLLQPIICDII